MQELSLNMLDVAQNSVAAGASLITLSVQIDTAARLLALEVEDNGRGMSPELCARVTDPFTTTRTTRRVGLGLPFFKMAAEMTGGSFELWSQEGRGTRVRATFTLGHIDLAPIGDMAGTVAGLIQCSPQIDFVYRVSADGDSFTADTREMRSLLGEVSLASPQVVLFITEYLSENTEPLLAKARRS